MNKIIFLDVDGVLNGETKLIYFLQSISKYTNDRIRKWLLEWDIFGTQWLYVFYLWIIVRCTNAKIVMSSSWRGGLDHSYEWLIKNQPDSRWKKLWDKFKFFHLDIIDRTPHLNGSHRGKEISSWINNHSVDKFIILDDESFDIKDIYPDQLIKTSHIDNKNRRITGLRFKYVIKAISKLNK